MDHHPAPHESIHDPAHAGVDEGSSPSIDHLALLWQRKWLLLLGLIAGLGGGFLKYTKEPAVFRSSARIQVVEPYSRNMPVEGIDPRGGGGNSIFDETMVIRSEKVLTRAAELGELTNDELFLGLAPAEVNRIATDPRCQHHTCRRRNRYVHFGNQLSMLQSWVGTQRHSSGDRCLCRTSQ